MKLFAWNIEAKDGVAYYAQIQESVSANSPRFSCILKKCDAVFVLSVLEFAEFDSYEEAESFIMCDLKEKYSFTKKTLRYVVERKEVTRCR